MTEVYFNGMGVAGFFCGLALVASVFIYVMERPRRHRYPKTNKKQARFVLASAFGGPVAVVLWPLALVALFGYGVSIVVRDALGKD